MSVLNSGWTIKSTIGFMEDTGNDFWVVGRAVTQSSCRMPGIHRKSQSVLHCRMSFQHCLYVPDPNMSQIARVCISRSYYSVFQLDPLLDTLRVLSKFEKG